VSKASAALIKETVALSAESKSRPSQLYNGQQARRAVFWFKELDISFGVTENKDRREMLAAYFVSDFAPRMNVCVSIPCMWAQAAGF
jgi:hypothetical protein